MPEKQIEVQGTDLSVACNEYILYNLLIFQLVVDQYLSISFLLVMFLSPT